MFSRIFQGFFRLKRAFLNPPFCAPTLCHPPTLRPQSVGPKLLQFSRLCQIYIKNSAQKTPSFENAPTCYKAPKRPDPEFPRKIPKKYPLARNSGLLEFTPKMPRKYRKNTPKIPKMCIFGIWGVFFRYFLGVPEFRPRGYFFGIFRGNSGSGHLGAL